MKKILSLSITFLSIIIFFGSAKQASAATFQQNVFIHNSTSTVLTDYQVKLNFNATNFDFANASSTGADIYFTDQNDTVLSHWIKTYSNIGTSTIWVKVPSLAANSTTTIHMHYGDNTVTTTYSNATSTFLFYDNFDTSSFSNWTGSDFNINSFGESASQSTSTDKYVSPFYSAKLHSYSSCMLGPFDGAGSTINRTLSLSTGTVYAVDVDVLREITGFRFSTTAGISDAVKINGFSVGGGSSNCSGFGCTYDSGWQDESNNFTTSSPITSITLSGYTGDCTDGNTFYDDVRIRKSASVEPVATLEVATVNYIAGTGGSILGTSVQSGFAGFNGTTVTATPSTGYSFTNWSDALFTASRTDSNITTNTSFTASFLINSYTLNYSANSGGAISGSSSQHINYGLDGSIVIATPNTGYHFVNWSDGFVSSTRMDAGVTGTISVAANFSISTNTLSYFAGGNGTLSGSSTQIVNYGSDGTAITAVGNSGYRFLNWSDGSTANPRTDTNTSGNVSATATFEIIPPAGGGSPIAPAGIGVGITDKTIPMNQTGNIGTITMAGVNYLSYINSTAGFDALVSGNNLLQNHHLNINNLDLSKNIVQFTIQSNPQTFNLKMGDSTGVDLDKDGKNDIEIKFVNIWVNRVELTIKSLFDNKEIKSNTAPEIVQTVNSYSFKRDLKLGMKGEDVKELQKYLNANGFVIDTTGVGSPGKESDRFGLLTKKAIIKFQKANGISPAVGYFGPMTRKLLTEK